jgi:hypothetical protein
MIENNFHTDAVPATVTQGTLLGNAEDSGVRAQFVALTILLHWTLTPALFTHSHHAGAVFVRFELHQRALNKTV